jgi:sugar-phosphatase
MGSGSFDAVIFDMDGVLIDSAAVYERHWRDWAESHGLDREAPIAVHHGHPAAETIALVAPDLDALAEAAAYNRTLAQDPSADGVVIMPGAMAVISDLSDSAWAIATSAPREMAERWLVLLGLPLPDILVTVEDVVKGKPAPDPYLLAAERLAVSPEACIVFEDAPPGITAGKAAGCTVVALATTHAPAALAAADAIAADLSTVSIEVREKTVVRWQDLGRG